MNYYNLNESKYGYILTSEGEKYVLNRSKLFDSPTPFYLKKVEPTNEYISGMFKDKNNDTLLRGRTKDGKRVVVTIGLNTATIDIS